jgi:hypothetical protein
MATAALQHRLQTSIETETTSNEMQNGFGKKIGLVASLFGCWHEAISRPFTQERATYRVCLNCGARKVFDPQTLQTSKSFYYPPVFRKINQTMMTD